MTSSPLAEHVKQAKQAMVKAVEAVKREFSTVRTGKATTSLLDLVRVEEYAIEPGVGEPRSRVVPHREQRARPRDAARFRVEGVDERFGLRD